MLNVLASVAQFERELMLERQREGIAKAKAHGKYKGRPKKLHKLVGKVLDLEAQGATRREIAELLEISERSVYRLLNGENGSGEQKPNTKVLGPGRPLKRQGLEPRAV